MSDDRDRGRQDGQRDAKTADKSGPTLGGIEKVIDEQAIAFSGESEEYQEAYKQALHDSLKK